MNWDIDSAIHELANGDPKTESFEDACDWLYALIAEHAPRGGLLIGAVAEMVIDKFREHREDE